MNFSIAIYSSPQNGKAARNALEFAWETLRQGHGIYRLFFFNDGVMNCADNNESVNKDWQSLIQTHQLDAIVCMASAQKRDLLGHESKQIESKHGQLDQQASLRQAATATINSAFNAGGIAQLIDATVQSDRVISFGG